MLHEVLTGRRLFKGENDLQTVERVRQCDVAPPSVHNPLCPPELDGIILRALARNRDERFRAARRWPTRSTTWCTPRAFSPPTWRC